ncbi:Crp/Fnr family transcriptional regulator [Beijerinckia sp. L45]|uniref:Crp/Fnr family transcriptional regulator n=1 Tax=Beijerinckia sp. L45 TaxID=1641855 RepID=UPI00131C94FB|nr:Crp/Fnr family transcriptional regulator [Beijerinckia sp. L45]
MSPWVRKLDHFAPLSPSDRLVLEEISTGGETHEAGILLAQAGDALEGIFVVVEGLACSFKLRSDGARQITAYLVPGDFCDVDVAPQIMDHCFGTLSACRIAKVSRETLRQVKQGRPAVAEALHISALVDEATLREWLMNIGRRSAEERIAHLFCELSTRMQAVGLVEDNSFRLPLTQFDLGDTLGLSYVHVNRTLQVLRQQGLIVLRGKTLTILDAAGLKALAEFNPGYLRTGARGTVASI